MSLFLNTLILKLYIIISIIIIGYAYFYVYKLPVSGKISV